MDKNEHLVSLGKSLGYTMVNNAVGVANGAISRSRHSSSPDWNHGADLVVRREVLRPSNRANDPIKFGGSDDAAKTLCLDEMEDCLTSAAIEGRMPALLAAREKLATLAGEIKQDIEGLREVAEKVADVAKVVKILTDAGKQTASLGA